MLVFEERGKPENPEKNLSEQRREPTANSTHIWRRRRDLNPGHISALITAPPLLPEKKGYCKVTLSQKDHQLGCNIQATINKLPLIGLFRVPPGLCFKTRVGAQPLIWKTFFILMQNSFSQERLCTWPHFESGGFWNSKVAYYIRRKVLYLRMYLISQQTSVRCVMTIHKLRSPQFSH